MAPGSILKPTTGNGKNMPCRRRKWVRKDLIVAGVVATVHCLCFFAPFTFSWGAFWLALLRYFTSGCLGITLCYHRCLTHGSFKLPKSVEYLFAYFGFFAFQGDPIFWVSAHRYHHKVTDTYKDPHSPIEGFWFSHINWLFDENYTREKGRNNGNVIDLREQYFYRFLRSTMALQYLLLLALLYSFGGFSFVVWGVGVPLTLGYHATFLVNSVCHKWGYQAWNTMDLSKNNWFVSLITFGEGWHNNHHAFEFSAQQGLEWWQVDMTWYMVRLLQYCGIATNVKIPTEAQKKKMSFTNRMEDIKIASNG